MIWVVGIIGGLFLLFAFPKQMLWLIAILTAIVGLFWGYNSYTASVEKSRRDSVFVVVEQSRKNCPPDYPIPVTFNNASSQTINSMSFSITASKMGYSDNAYLGYYTSTKILGPHQMFETCYSLIDYDWATSTALADRAYPAFYGWTGSPSTIEFKD